ncbi:MAG TPA: antitoxin family protein [Gemmataceae bacterium]|nr:antitoxin family protein [Gemmataceae bacterium]
MKGLEIEAVYEHGTLKLPRELPLVEGAVVTITIHPPERPGMVKHLCIPWTGSLEEFDRWLNDPDEGILGCHDDEFSSGDPISPDPDCRVFVDATESRTSSERESLRD